MSNMQPYMNQAYDFIHGGFATVNAQVGLLIIALLAAVMMKEWKQLWTMSLGAVIIQIIALAFMPLLTHGKFALPDFLTLSFWAGALALYIGFVIVITAFFFLKKNVFKMA
jgi:hypothetical protein